MGHWLPEPHSLESSIDEVIGLCERCGFPCDASRPRLLSCARFRTISRSLDNHVRSFESNTGIFGEYTENYASTMKKQILFAAGG